MPLYSYHCQICDNVEEAFNSVPERHANAPRCHDLPMGIAIQPVSCIGFISTFTEHYDWVEGKYFGSKEEKDKHLQSVGKTQTSGKVCPSGRKDFSNKMQVPCSREEAKRIDSGQLNPHQGSDRRITVG